MAMDQQHRLRFSWDEDWDYLSDLKWSHRVGKRSTGGADDTGGLAIFGLFLGCCLAWALAF